MKTFYQNSLLLLVLLLGLNSLQAQLFADLYMGEGDQGGAIVKIYDNHIYRAGNVTKNGQIYANFSKYSMNGAFLWMVELEQTSSFADFIKTTEEDAFLLVGTTQPFNTSSSSVLAKIDVNGNLLWVQNIETTNREIFNRIRRSEGIAGVANPFPYYISQWVNKPGGGSTSDDAGVFSVDVNGNIGIHSYYRTLNSSSGVDYQVNRVFLPLPGGGFALMGSYTPFTGHIIEIDVNGDVVQALDTDQQLDIRDAWQDPITRDIVAVGAIGNSTEGFIIRFNLDGTVHWAVRTPAINALIKIEHSNNDGLFYVVGYGSTFNSINKSYIIRLEDAGQAPPQLEWVRHLEEGETFFGSAVVQLTNNDEILYHDARTGNPKGSGMRDYLMGIFDDELSSCITEEVEIELVEFEFSLSPNEVARFPQEYTVTTDTVSNEVDIDQVVLCCGGVVEDTLDFSCTPQNSYEYTFSLENYTEYNVNSVFISVPAGFSLDNQYWTGSSPLPIPANGGSAGPFNVTITPDNPITSTTTLCLDIIYLSDGYECCHFEHCITLEPIDPCDYKELEAMKNDEEGCCYDIELFNDYCDDYFIGIQTEILTPGVTFADYSGGTTWTANPNSSNTIIDWTNASGFIPTGVVGDMAFCLEGIVTTSQVPQFIAFNWIAVDPATGEQIVACTDTLEFECEPCMDIVGEVLCDDEGNYLYNFTINNNSDPATDATAILFEMNTPGVDFDPNYIVTALPAGGSYSGTVGIDGVLSPGDVVNFKVLLIDDEGWCCHLDSIEIVMPECEQVGCQCTDFETYVGQVNQGFTTQIDCASEIATFTPVALSECDTTVFTYFSQDFNPIQSGLNGGASPVEFAWPVDGTYEVCMTVYRYDENGNFCYGDIFEQYCEDVQLLCPTDDPFVLDAEVDLTVGDVINLDWELPPAQQFDVLRIERQHKEQWRTIAMVDAYTTSFQDKAPHQGENVYQISGVVGAMSWNSRPANAAIAKSTELQVQLYPNPAREEITLVLSESGNYTIRVFNANGQMVKQQRSYVEAASNQQMRVADLTSGVFILSIQAEDGTVVQQRFVKLASW